MRALLGTASMTDKPQTQEQPAERRSGSETRRRTVLRTFRCTPDEAAAIDALAAANGGLGALVRNALLAIPLPRRRRAALIDLAAVADVRHELANLRGELGKIGSNVNQIAHQLNAKEGVVPTYLDAAIARLDETLCMFPEFRDAYMRAMGAERPEDEE
jgi:mobilization protein NikA